MANPSLFPKFMKAGGDIIFTNMEFTMDAEPDITVDTDDVAITADPDVSIQADPDVQVESD